MTKKVRSDFGNPFAADLPLQRWRGELRSLAHLEAVRWAFRVTRLETNPANAHALLVEMAPEIPPEHRGVYDGAAALLLSHIGTLRAPGVAA